jgi:hypothetical protein
MRVWRLVSVVGLAAAGVLLIAGSAGAGTWQPTFRPSPGFHPAGGPPAVCNGSDGGVIAPGVYNSLVVTGVCSAPAGNVIIRGDLTIAPGALLDAVTPGDPTTTPLLPAHVVIGGSVWVGADGVFVLGCSPNISCPNAISDDSIGGSVTAVNALAVVIHSTSIGGSVSIDGGGGGAAGGAASGGCFTSAIPAPWSEDANLSNPTTGSPQFTDFEDNSIGGNLSIVGMQTCWMGSFRNQVGGSATFVNDGSSDPDGMEIDNNLVNGDMACWNDVPAVQFGDSGAAPNIVGNAASGQCGFNVEAPNPAPEADEGTGILEHLAVPQWSLPTYYGIRTITSEESAPPATTSAGQTLTLELGTEVYSGWGLNGSVTSKGAFTTSPDGITTFEDVDSCACSLWGYSGNTQIRAYGTTLPNGTTYGTFLVIAGGTDPGGPSLGGLATLAGYGTFTSVGAAPNTLRTVSHLRVT